MFKQEGFIYILCGFSPVVGNSSTSAVMKYEAEEVPAAESEDLGVSGISAHFLSATP